MNHLSTRRLLLSAAVLTSCMPPLVWSAGTAQADDFHLAMVIKSSTNPYYKATLSGAEIAAKEIGGTVENLGPTESSAKAQVGREGNFSMKTRTTPWQPRPTPQARSFSVVVS